MQPNCLNCNGDIQPGMKYCPGCGQRTVVHRLSFHEIGHDAIHYFTHADKSVFTLLKELAIRPGIVAREFISGRRQKYFKPLNIFLIVAGIVVFMTSSFHTVDDSRSRQIESAAMRIPDPVKRQEVMAMAGRTRQVNTITGKYSNVINMVATPLLTLMFWLFYRRRFNYVESLAGNMYFIAFIMLFYSLLIVPLRNILPSMEWILLGIFFLFEIVYRGYAYYQFDGKKRSFNVFKAYGVSLLITLIWIALTYALIMYYVRQGF